MIIEISQLLPAFITYIVGAASPGLGNMAIATASVQQGRSSGFAVMIGVIAAGQAWAICAAIGLSSMLVTVPKLIQLVGVSGGFYLMWNGYKTLQQKRFGGKIESNREIYKLSVFTNIRTGFLIQILNPKAVLGWILIISIGVRVDSPWYTPLAIIFVCFLLGLVIFSTYVCCFSYFGDYHCNSNSGYIFQKLIAFTYGASGLWLMIESMHLA